MSQANKSKVCQICQGMIEADCFVATEKMFGTGEAFPYGKCSSCGCVQLLAPPKNFGPYYSTYFGRVELETSGWQFNLRKLRFLSDFTGKSYGGRLLSYLFEEPSAKSIKLLDIDKDAAILDVGCSDGFLLYMLKEIGYSKVYGCDPFISNDIHYENGLIIEKKELKDISEKYDYVMLHHVFEHIPGQAEMLNDIYRILKPGGVLLIRIPISSSHAFENYKENWFQLDAPRHIFLHSIDSIQLLLHKTNYTVSSIYCDSTIWQFISSELYKRGIPFTKHLSKYAKMLPFLIMTGKFFIYKRRVNLLNRSLKGDQVVIVAKKL